MSEDADYKDMNIQPIHPRSYCIRHHPSQFCRTCHTLFESDKVMNENLLRPLSSSDRRFLSDLLVRW